MTSTVERTALVVGGTGPTGPFVVAGLVERGYRVTMLHTGRHEVASTPDSVEHIHTDPFDTPSMQVILGNRTFDVAVAMYGRLRHTSELLEGRVGHLISVGGAPVYHGYAEPHLLWPPGLQVPTRESAPLASTDPGANLKVARIVESERALFDHHPTATHFRFPLIYGPRQLMPREWMIVRRALDGRRRIILPDGGLTLVAAVYSENAAQALLCAVDRPSDAAGQVFNVSDEWTPTLSQWVLMLGRALDHEFEIVSMPFAFATPSWPLLAFDHPHHRVLPVDKALYGIGYHDVVRVDEALRRTARWLAKNPPDQSDTIPSGDRFDYDGEDRLMEEWDRAVVGVTEIAAQVRALPSPGSRYAMDFKAESSTEASGWTFLKR